MKLRAIAGVVDAGGAAATNFLAGLIAVRLLDDGALTLYSLLSIAAVLAMLFPQQVGYLPYRLHVNVRTTNHRPSYWASVRIAFFPSLVIAPIVIAAGFPAFDMVTGPEYWATVSATCAFAVVSPFQDHLRMSLHVVGAHWRAAVVSAANFSVLLVCFTVAVLVPADVSAPSYVPFLALALANSCSAALAAVLLVPFAPFNERPAGTLRSRSKLLVSDAIMQGMGYLSAAAVAVVLGAAASAALEAARVAAQPIYVLSTALANVYVPRIIRAVGNGERRAVARMVSRLSAVTVLAGTAYAAILLVAAPFVGALIGRTFEGPLGATRGLSFSAQAATSPFNSVYYAAGKVNRAIILSAVSALTGLAVLALSIGVLGVYAVPACLLAAAIVRLTCGMLDIRGAEMR